MEPLEAAIKHIRETAAIPSFSTRENRLHPYIRTFFGEIKKSVKDIREISVKGESLVYLLHNNSDHTVALAAHMDKINHYGSTYPDVLPVKETQEYIKGAMDDSAGVGILLALAGIEEREKFPNLLFFFSEMEESKGLKEHPELLRNKGKGYHPGMGAERIVRSCISEKVIPEIVITIDTTPLFKGKSGLAIYARHWELTDLEPDDSLVKKTDTVVEKFLTMDSNIQIANNTNDYLQYGYEFNKRLEEDVISIALEPAIFPYHQLGEKVFKSDIKRTVNILTEYLSGYGKVKE